MAKGVGGKESMKKYGGFDGPARYCLNYEEELLDLSREAKPSPSEDPRIMELLVISGESNYLDGEGYRFSRSAKFGALLANGWTDAWRTMHPLGNEFSWYSQKNNGFRIDHILLSTGLRGCLEKAEFSHVERETGTSDHSILAVELKPQ